MSRAEYMRIHSEYFPPDIRASYHIDGLIAADGYVYIKIVKGMYVIKQAAIISYNKIIYQMDTHGYYPVPFTNRLWEQNTRRTKTFLCVDVFGVKCFTKDYANRLLDYLKITVQFQQIGRVAITPD